MLFYVFNGFSLLQMNVISLIIDHKQDPYDPVNFLFAQTTLAALFSLSSVFFVW